MRQLAILAGLALAAVGAQAQLNKCVDAGGRVTYGDRACPTTSAASAIKAPPIAEPTARDAYAAQVRRQNMNEEVARIDRQRATEAAEARARSLTVASEKVRRLKRENFHPARCAEARHALAAMKRRDPVGWQLDVSAFERLQQIELYCGP